MSLDVILTVDGEVVFEENITHNLNKMASAVADHFYKAVWRPEELDVDVAWKLVKLLENGLLKLLAHPAKFKEYNPENGWGDYDGLVAFLVKYIQACNTYPNAEVTTCR